MRNRDSLLRWVLKSSQISSGLVNARAETAVLLEGCLEQNATRKKNSNGCAFGGMFRSKCNTENKLKTKQNYRTPSENSVKCDYYFSVEGDMNVIASCKLHQFIGSSKFGEIFSCCY